MRKKLKKETLNELKKIFLLLALCLILTACANGEVKEKTTPAGSISLNQKKSIPADNQKSNKIELNNKDNKMEENKYPFEEFKEDAKIVIKTNKGDIELDLYGSKAPITVGNFVNLIKSNFYNDIKFHRVIGDFMIQTGDPQTRGEVGVNFVYDPYNNPDSLPIAGTGGPGYKFEDEFNNGLVFDKAGVLAMANSGPNTNGSQIFITHGPTTWLNNQHTIFGQVTKGQDIVDAIEQGDVIEEIIIK